MEVRQSCVSLNYKMKDATRDVMTHQIGVSGATHSPKRGEPIKPNTEGSPTPKSRAIAMLQAAKRSWMMALKSSAITATQQTQLECIADEVKAIEMRMGIFAMI